MLRFLRSDEFLFFLVRSLRQELTNRLQKRRIVKYVQTSTRDLIAIKSTIDHLKTDVQIFYDVVMEFNANLSYDEVKLHLQNFYSKLSAINEGMRKVNEYLRLAKCRARMTKIYHDRIKVPFFIW